MRVLKKGQIVKVTRYSVECDGGGSRCASPAKPLWASVDDDEGLNFICGGNHNAKGELFEFEGSSYGWGWDNWDRIKVVPDNEVPDEVWVELAKRALMGESE